MLKSVIDVLADRKLRWASPGRTGRLMEPIGADNSTNDIVSVEARNLTSAQDDECEVETLDTE